MDLGRLRHSLCRSHSLVFATWRQGHDLARVSRLGNDLSRRHLFNRPFYRIRHSELLGR